MTKEDHASSWRTLLCNASMKRVSLKQTPEQRKESVAKKSRPPARSNFHRLPVCDTGTSTRSHSLCVIDQLPEKKMS